MGARTPSDSFQPKENPEAMDGFTRSGAIERVSDHWHKRGVRSRRGLVLSLVVLGKVAGRTSLTEIGEGVRWRAGGYKQAFPCPGASGR